MTIPKKPSKEPPLPSQDETRRANVLREEMLSQFRTLGEAFSLLRDDVQNMKPQLAKIDKLDGDAEILKSAVRSQGTDIRAIKSDVAEIKTDLKNYNQRLEVVETQLAS